MKLNNNLFKWSKWRDATIYVYTCIEIMLLFVFFLFRFVMYILLPARFFTLTFVYSLCKSGKINGFVKKFWTSSMSHIANCWHSFLFLLLNISSAQNIESEEEKEAKQQEKKNEPKSKWEREKNTHYTLACQTTNRHTAERNIRLINFTRNKCMRSNLKQKRSIQRVRPWTKCTLNVVNHGNWLWKRYHQVWMHERNSSSWTSRRKESPKRSEE